MADLTLWHRIPAVLGGVLLAAASLAAAAPLKVIEQAIETSTLAVTLPDRSTGSMYVRACPSCKALELQLTPRSKYRVGKREVTFAELRQYALGAGSRSVDVFYDAKSLTITRLTVAGELPPRRTR